MTERDVARVEKKLDIRLPAHYRQFLIEHGAAVAKAKRGGGFVPFFTTVKEIIEANEALRADPNRQPTNQDTEPWPLKYLIVGTDGGGDYWCVDLTGKREVIWQFDSEAGGTFRHATPSTWAEYLEQLRSPPKPIDLSQARNYLCKKGRPAADAADAAGDGGFTLTDAKGRAWVCWERKPVTPEEEILARVRGEFVMPSWVGEKGVYDLIAMDPDALRAQLSKER